MATSAVFIIFFLISFGHDVDGGTYGIFTPDLRLSGFVMEKIVPIGMEMCVRECSKRVSCASLNFQRSSLECELSFSDDSENPSDLTSDLKYIYVSRSQIPTEYSESCNASCSLQERCVSAASGPKCVTSDCPDLHPDATISSVMVTATKVGTVLTYTCNSDPSITLTSTCRSNGTWSSSAYLCGQQSYPPDCFNTTNSCWYKYNFTHDTAWNGCPGGPKYVKKTQFVSAPLVGVVLCNSTRYKIFLGANLTDTFLNVGDGNGHGADHCELVGGLEADAVLAGDYMSSPELTGYARSGLGEEFFMDTLSGATGWWTDSWYECGIEIPGPQEPPCMSASPPCWYAYKVPVDESFNGCSGGKTVVKKTNFTSAPYLAVVLCNSTRYKFFLGANLTTTFLNIGDGSGSGEDQCELVGGSETSAVVAGDFASSPAVTGYYRRYVGEEFTVGNIGYMQSSYHFNTYLECGVAIPGTDPVVF
ncbi:uncharacterized protein LOC133201714 [Saccostrea echinata]|uniref:uncharacterized protein LOC133201714 n=1 Tax=Saccostrea echinata TaxID=191078 RepID=UPI002A807FD9|nr:uncharacterized protein LOC133201714 [Saccostrea echinata]